MLKQKKEKKQTKKDFTPKYCTYGLADDDRIDEKTNATRPSDEAVEQVRDWSIENKL